METSLDIFEINSDYWQQSIEDYCIQFKRTLKIKLN